MRRCLMPSGAILALCLAAAPGVVLASNPQRATRDAQPPVSHIAAANAAARVQPSGENYLNATQVYAYEAGALFQVYGAPGHVTDIALQPGEALAAQGAVAAGDTVRWIIGQTESGAGEARRTHIARSPNLPLRHDQAAEAMADARLFDRWMPWVPGQGQCLYRAYLLRAFLASRGRGATWVFGVRTWPFSAHCWLQVGDVLLDDDLDRVALYTPIMAVGV